MEATTLELSTNGHFFKALLVEKILNKIENKDPLDDGEKVIADPLFALIEMRIFDARKSLGIVSERDSTFNKGISVLDKEIDNDQNTVRFINEAIKKKNDLYNNYFLYDAKTIPGLVDGGKRKCEGCGGYHAQGGE